MSDSQPILSVRNVSKAFGAVRALNQVSFDVNRGQVVALAGDNGAGKSTIIKAISGVFRHDAGEILLAGEPINFATPHEARENGIETIYQDLALAENLSIGENIFLGREPKRRLFGFLPILDRKKEDGEGNVKKYQRPAKRMAKLANVPECNDQWQRAHKNGGRCQEPVRRSSDGNGSNVERVGREQRHEYHAARHAAAVGNGRPHEEDARPGKRG